MARRNDLRLAPRGSPDEVVLVAEDNDDVRAFGTETLREPDTGVIEASEGAPGRAEL